MSLILRPTLPEDAEDLKRWLLQPDVMRYFPMNDVREVEDATRIWISYCHIGAGLTALWDGVPCGSAILNIQPFKKLAHQCLLSIIVDEAHRGRGIGTQMIRELKKIAVEKFKIEILHLEVYANNPAINLYKREGFTEFGCQSHFIKESGGYVGKIYMECILTGLE